MKHGFLRYRNKQTFLIGKNVLILIVPILTNKDVFEPSYNDLKFTIWNHNYFLTNWIIRNTVSVKIDKLLNKWITAAIQLWTRQMKRTTTKNKQTNKKKQTGDPGEGRDWFSESLQYSVVQSWNKMNQKRTAIRRNKINRSHFGGSPKIGFSRWRLQLP